MSKILTYQFVIVFRILPFSPLLPAIFALLIYFITRSIILRPGYIVFCFSNNARRITAL